MLDVVGSIIVEAIGVRIASLFGTFLRSFLRLLIVLVLVAAFTIPLAYWYFSN